jgi:transposase
MDASSLTPDAPLPDDVPSLQALVRQLLAEVARLRAENAELKGKLDAALKHRFGRRSERRRERPPADPDRPPPRRDRHGRAPLPEHLERRTLIHDLTEAEKLCPCCGRPRVCIGEQTAEQLDMEPARFFVLRTVKKTYACQHCDPRVPAEQRMQTAGPPEVGPIARGLCGPGLLAHVITAKFADHLPLHRLAGQLARCEAHVARSTLGDWLGAAARLLLPLYALMHQRLLCSRVLHGDDTGVKLRLKGAKSTAKAHLWVYIGDADYPYVLFDFTADYTAAGPEGFLSRSDGESAHARAEGAAPAARLGYAGYLQADALAQYEGLYGPQQVKHVCCWAHARRKFVTAVEGKDERGNQALELIRQLYAIERQLPPLLPPSDDPAAQQQRQQREELRRQRRVQQAEPVLTELKRWLDEQKPLALPKSPLGQAIGYALNNWAALCRYTEQGYLAIDNNLSERTLRAIAVGRNNWGVIGSEAAGKTAAVLSSVVGTCKHLGIDPFVYLKEALPGLFALGEKPTAEQLLAWLPDRWLLCRARAAPSQPAATG